MLIHNCSNKYIKLSVYSNNLCSLKISGLKTLMSVDSNLRYFQCCHPIPRGRCAHVRVFCRTGLLWRVICKSHQGFKRYRADTTVCLVLYYHIGLEVSLVIMCSAHRLVVFNIWAKSFQNVTNPPRVKDRTRTTVIQCLTLNYGAF